MKNRIGSIAIAVCLLGAGTLMTSAQSLKVDHFSQAELTQMAHAMDGKIQNGIASDDLSKYPNHFTMLILRNKNGGAEVHENFADFFVVVEGHATLVSGGTLKEPKTASPRRDSRYCGREWQERIRQSGGRHSYSCYSATPIADCRWRPVRLLRSQDQGELDLDYSRLTIAILAISVKQRQQNRSLRKDFTR